MMITLAGIRNVLWCTLALAIVACAAAPLANGKLAAADTAITNENGDVAAGIAEQPVTPYADAQVSLADAGVVQTDRGFVLTLDAGTFDSGRAVIHPDARRGLDALARYLVENPDRHVQVEAFTDAGGANANNLELSQDRADAVALALIDRGIDAARVRAIGWGERRPTDDHGEGARRVEILVSKENAVVPVRVVSSP